MRNTYLAILLIYKLSIGAKIGDHEWPWTAKWPLFCVFAEFGSLRGTLRKSDWQFTITMSSKKTTAEGPRDAHGIHIL